MTLDDIIDLDALAEPIAQVRLFGNVHAVLPITGNGASMLEQISEISRSKDGPNLAQSLEVARRLIALSVPSLDETERQRLTVQQITALTGIMTRTVDSVKAVIASAEGNGSDGPMERTTASGPSSDHASSTPSAPPSSE